MTKAFVLIAFFYTSIFMPLVSPDAGATEPLHIVIPPIEKSAEAQALYFYKLLLLVLAKTEATDGPYDVKFYPRPLSTERFLVELKNGGAVNLMWTTSNKKREQELLPIRISLLKDLNSYRIFLIRNGDQAKFDKVQSLDDLRKLNAGLGSQWPDTDVMRENDLHVVTSLSYDSLFKMLAAKRFDYFPRGLYEVWDEAELHKDMGLEIEQHLMLYYEAPFYFFVSKTNLPLASRIERGLKMAIEDGSFDELLMSVPGFKRGIEEQLNSHRKLFKLTNRTRSE